MAILRFEEWAAVNEMAARRSFNRTLGKYGPEVVTKPVATMTAWRGELLDPSGRPYPETTRRKFNDEANRKLMANIRRRGLSCYPVVGAGQEECGGLIKMNREESLVVQPVGR